MNKDYVPIIGECSLEKKKFVVNVVFFEKLSLNTSQGIIEGEKDSCRKMIFDLGDKIEIGDFIFDSNFTPIFNILNCDCQFVTECGLKEKVSDRAMNFHIGDQIYLDHLFLDFCIGNYVSSEIRRLVYKEYKKTFLRKARILQNSFNIMLGDDHEIADETLREYDKTGEVTKIFKQIFYEIQGNLRLDENNTLINIENNSFVLIDNIETRTPENYLKNMNNIFNGHKANLKNNVFILTTRNITNMVTNKINKLIYSSSDIRCNYYELYNSLFSEVKSGKKLRVICGDEHSSAKFIIQRGNLEIEYYFNGPLNSVPEILCNEYKLEDKFTKVYHEKKYGYIEISNGEIHHNILDIDCCTHNLVVMQYIKKIAPRKILGFFF